MFLNRVQLKQPNHDKPHSKLDVRRGLLSVHAPKVPQTIFRGVLKRAGQGPFGQDWTRGSAEQHVVRFLARASTQVVSNKFTLEEKSWSKTETFSVCNQLIASCQREKFQSASSYQREKFQSAWAYGKLHCIHRQENSSLPGIWKKCILQTVVL